MTRSLFQFKTVVRTETPISAFNALIIWRKLFHSARVKPMKKLHFLGERSERMSRKQKRELWRG
jgi:hypothetical protein